MPSPFGLRVATARKRKRMSQVELAEQCEVSDSTVSSWESGERFPREKHLIALARALDTTPSRLLADTKAA